MFWQLRLGDLMIDAGFHVAFDGRYYRYDADEWAGGGRSRLGQVSVAELDARYRPVAWLLEPAGDGPLIAALRQQPDRWREAGHDSAAVLFLPMSAPRRFPTGPEPVTLRSAL